MPGFLGQRKDTLQHGGDHEDPVDAFPLDESEEVLRVEAHHGHGRGAEQDEGYPARDGACMVERSGDEAPDVAGDRIADLGATEPVEEAELEDQVAQVLGQGHPGRLGQIAEGIPDAHVVVHVLGRARGPPGVGIQRDHEVGLGHGRGGSFEQVLVTQHALGHGATHDDVVLDARHLLPQGKDRFEELFVEDERIRPGPVDGINEAHPGEVPIEEGHGTADE